MDHAEELFALAQSLVDDWPDFFTIKGAGAGDQATNAFMRKLRQRAEAAWSRDFAEQRISGDNKLAVDFYFPEEATIVEVALSLRNPMSEFERDILKAIMAQEAGHPVRHLVFFSKPGARARCAQPGLQAFGDWASRKHGVNIAIREFTSNAEKILEATVEDDG